MLDLQSSLAAIQRAESAFDLIVNFEDAWNQNYWRNTSPTSSCGTALCFAGWTAADSPYENLIPDIHKFLEAADIDTHNDDYFDSEGELFSAMAIPGDDPIAESVLVQPDPVSAWWFGGHNSPGAQELLRLASRFTEGTVFITAEHLASHLLGIDGSGIMDHHVFNWSNNLERIREHIDNARGHANLGRRDFQTEPVQVRIDELTPAAMHPIIRQRVAGFNERASASPRVIATEGELERARLEEMGTSV